MRGVLLFDILYGILLAIGLSVVDLLARVARPHAAVLGRIPGLAGMHDIDDFPEAELVPGLVVYRYESPLFFANAQDFRHRALAAVDASPTPVAWFVLNTEAIVDVDMAIDAWRRCARPGVRHRVRPGPGQTGALAAAARRRVRRPDRTRPIFPTLPTAWPATGVATWGNGGRSW